MSVSPPKPWERAGAGAISTALSEAPPSPSYNLSTAQDTSSSAPPPVPPRPAGASSLASGYRPGGYAGATGLTSPYGTGYGGNLGYSGAYNRFGSGYGGGYGNSYGSSYGSGYGGGYGGAYGSRYSSYGTGYGGSMYGPNRSYMGGGGVGPYDPMGGPLPGDPSLVQRMEAGTASTFQMLESIVGVFAGLSQMLESTYMATHSSFMAMVGVAEQFGHLRGYLGQVLSVFALVRLLKRCWAWLRGKSSPSAASFTLANFESFVPGQVGPSSGSSPVPAKPSRRPLLLFLAVIVGLPWLVSRLIKTAAARSASGPATDPATGAAIVESGKKIRAADLEFVRALHPFEGDGKVELTLAPGDLVAVLSKGEGWWRGRTRDGRVGIFPANYVELLEKRKSLPDISSSSSSEDSGVAIGSSGAPAVANAPAGSLDPEEFSRRMS